jgi:hypothetical protein
MIHATVATTSIILILTHESLATARELLWKESDFKEKLFRQASMASCLCPREHILRGTASSVNICCSSTHVPKQLLN